MANIKKELDYLKKVKNFKEVYLHNKKYESDFDSMVHNLVDFNEDGECREELDIIINYKNGSSVSMIGEVSADGFYFENGVSSDPRDQFEDFKITDKHIGININEIYVDDCFDWVLSKKQEESMVKFFESKIILE